MTVYIATLSFCIHLEIPDLTVNVERDFWSPFMGGGEKERTAEEQRRWRGWWWRWWWWRGW